VQCIYGNAHHPEILTELHTPVEYHNSKPAFYTEAKLKLPLRVQPRHHLMLRVKHVNVRLKSGKKDKPTETEVGIGIFPYPQIVHLILTH
jgi:hypothetical protein